MSSAAAAVSRDPFMPERPPGMRTGLALALVAHALLVAGLAYSVDWHASEPAAVEAELWSSVPQQAAPRAMSPEPAPSPAPAPAPAPRPAPPPAAAPTPRPAPAPPPIPARIDPQIATERAREARRVEAQQASAEQENLRREKARKDDLDHQAAERAQQQARDDQARKKQQAERQAAAREQAKEEQLRKEKVEQAASAVQQAAARAAYLKRMQGLMDASGDGKATGKAPKSSGQSGSYGGRVRARIQPNIVFPDAIDSNPVAVVDVKVAPDGTIIGRQLVQSSGVKAWDDAVLRAVDRTDGLPRDIDGSVPPVIRIEFKPRSP